MPGSESGFAADFRLPPLSFPAELRIGERAEQKGDGEVEKASWDADGGAASSYVGRNAGNSHSMSSDPADLVPGAIEADHSSASPHFYSERELLRRARLVRLRYSHAPIALPQTVADRMVLARVPRTNQKPRGLEYFSRSSRVRPIWAKDIEQAGGGSRIGASVTARDQLQFRLTGISV